MTGCQSRVNATAVLLLERGSLAFIGADMTLASGLRRVWRCIAAHAPGMSGVCDVYTRMDARGMNSRVKLPLCLAVLIA